MDTALLQSGGLEFALCDLSPNPAEGRGYLYRPMRLSESGEVEIPTEVLLWRNGITKTTKGQFLLDDKARDSVWKDWQERMAGVLSPTGDPPGSFDYDHDEWNPELPGYEKLSAGSFDLGRDGKDLWLVKVSFTERCTDLIKKKEKRSTSPAFDFDPKSGRFLRLYNVAVTNVPATHKQALLASLGAQGKLLLPPEQIVLEPPPTAPAAPTPPAEPPPRTLVQVPITLNLDPKNMKPEDMAQLQQDVAAAVFKALNQAIDSGIPAAAPPAPAPEPAPAPARTATTKGPVPYAEYALDDSEDWDAAAAEARLKTWATGEDGEVDLAQYAKGFAYVAGEGEQLGDYKLPHHDVKDGELVTVWGGVKAAGTAIQNGTVEIPEDDLATVKAHLEKHYREFGKQAPWQQDEGESAAARSAPPPATAPAPAATTRSNASMWYDSLSPEDLVMIRMGQCADSLFLSATLAKKASGEDREMFTAQMATSVKCLGELASYAAKLAMPGLSDTEVMAAVDQDELSLLSVEHKTAYLAVAKFKPLRGVQALSSAMVQLGVDSPDKMRPAIVDLQEQVKDRDAQVERALKLAGSNVGAARTAKIADLQKRGLMSAATAQEAEGLDPVTGKPRMVTLMAGGKPTPARPWTMGELEDFAKRAEERLKQGAAAQASLSALSGGSGVGAPAPSAAPAAQPPALPSPGEPTQVITEDEIDFVIAAVQQSGGTCTRDQAMAQLKKNKAGLFGPAAATA